MMALRSNIKREPIERNVFAQNTLLEVMKKSEIINTTVKRIPMDMKKMGSIARRVPITTHRARERVCIKKTISIALFRPSVLEYESLFSLSSESAKVFLLNSNIFDRMIFTMTNRPNVPVILHRNIPVTQEKMKSGMIPEITLWVKA